MNNTRSLLFVALCSATASVAAPASAQQPDAGHAKNVILFIGDGMGVSTITATRVYSVGVDGKLAVDTFPYVALSRTYSADAITADSAPTMSSMVSGVNTSNGVMGFGPSCENKDFNHDGDGPRTTTILELAKAAGKKVGVVSTARITHATPAACFAHTNNRDNENNIALQALPGDAAYNAALGTGIDLLFGGGRSFFVPNTSVDEEGDNGSRGDGRDLRQEFQNAGYSYVWNKQQFSALNYQSLPTLGLFESSHMEYEYDRPLDVGGEPSLTEMTTKAIRMLRESSNGFFLMVEAGRIDHAHHAGNAFRALTDCEELDRALRATLATVSLKDTLILVSADHSHVFNISGYPLRPASELSYPIGSVPAAFAQAPHSGLLDVVYDINTTSGNVQEAADAHGVPYTVLVYGNGPGYRGASRVNPWNDSTPGLGGVIPQGPRDPAYLQEAAVPMGSETHAGEEVAIYAIGKGSSQVRGTVKNAQIFTWIRAATGL
ncbi:MAG TPA: alkaline phosphatase [Planctomycetota bacterium]|nr:alkaline phosphatase [Planctomycetota bacterium]